MFKILRAVNQAGSPQNFGKDVRRNMPGVPDVDPKVLREVERELASKRQVDYEALRINSIYRERPLLKRKMIVGFGLVSFVVAECNYNSFADLRCASIVTHALQKPIQSSIPDT